MSKSTQVAATMNTSPAAALPEELLAALAQDAKATSATERPSVSNISLRAGMLSYAGEPVKGNKLGVVILFASHLNTFYSKAWDPDTPASPDCFALSTTGSNMVPHENVGEPLSAKCATCPKAQWGSDIRDGKPAKGKACKETRRLVLIPASALTSAEEVEMAELAMLRLPVTSVKAWANFVNTLDATVSLPYYAVVTEVTTQPDIKTQFKVLLTPTQRIGDAAILQAIMKKRKEAERIAMAPFEATESDDEETAATEKF
jgi:hypothetical protein